MISKVVNGILPIESVFPRAKMPLEPCLTCGALHHPRPDHPALVVPVCDACLTAFIMELNQMTLPHEGDEE